MASATAIIILNLSMLLLNTAVTSIHSVMVMKEVRRR